MSVKIIFFQDPTVGNCRVVFTSRLFDVLGRVRVQGDR